MSALKRMEESSTVASGEMIRWGPTDDQHATPWDDLPREWGRKDRPMWALRKAFRREKLLGTW